MIDPTARFFQLETEEDTTLRRTDRFFSRPVEDGSSQPSQAGTSARGQLLGTQENLQQNIDRLTEMLNKPGLSDKQIAQINQQIERYKAELQSGYTREERERPGAERFIRGAQAGAIQGLMLPAEAVAGFVPGKAGDWARRHFEEAREATRQEFAPAGAAGMGGQFLGSLATSLPGFGAQAQLGMRGARALTTPGSPVGRAVRSVIDATEGVAGAAAPSVAQRVGANVVSGAPINLGFAAGMAQGTGEDETPEMRAMRERMAGLDIGVGTAADIAFGLLPIRGARRPRGAPAAPAAPVEPPRPERLEELEQMKKVAAQRQQQKNVKREISRRAKAQFEANNPEALWKNLNKSERLAYVDSYTQQIEEGELPAPTGYVRKTVQDQMELPIGQATTPEAVTATTPPAAASTDSNLNKAQQLSKLEAAIASVQDPGARQIIEKRINGLRDALRGAHRKSELDDLTGLGNRRALNRALPAAEADPNMAVGKIDVVGLGETNNKYGDLAGDALIRNVGEIAHQVTQEVGNVRVFRRGGDEFVFVGPPANVDAAQRRMVELGVGKNIEFYAGAGHNFAEADAAMNIAKVGRKGAPRPPAIDPQQMAFSFEDPDVMRLRLRDEAAERVRANGGDANDPAQVMAEMEPPLTQDVVKMQQGLMGVTDDEAQALIEQLKAAGASEAEIRSAIQEFTTDELGPLSEMAVTGKGRVGAKVNTERLLQILGAKMYSGDPGVTIVKEGIQNAIDAIRPRMAEGLQGRLAVIVNQRNRSFDFSDNGVGMLHEVVSKEFVDPAESLKQAMESSGGYGLAKIGLFTNADRIRLQTTARRGDVIEETILTGSGKDWIEGNMKMETRRVTDHETGTDLTIQVDKETANKIMWNNLSDWVEEAHASNMLPLDISYKEADWHGNLTELDFSERTFGFEPKPKFSEGAYETPYVEMTDDGGAEIHFMPSKESGEAHGIEVTVLNNGFFQFKKHEWLPGKPVVLPRKLLVDVRSKVPVTHANYPFATNREQLSSSAEKLKQQFIVKVHRLQQIKELDNLVQSLRDAPRTQDGFAIVATDGGIDPVLALQISRAQYAERFTTLASDAMENIYGAAAEYFPEMPIPMFGGMGLGKSYLGLNIETSALSRLALDNNILGANELPSENLILLNPFVTAYDLQNKFNLAPSMMPSAAQMAHANVGTLVHEVAHQIGRDEGSAFQTATRILSYVFKRNPDIYDRFYDFWDEALSDRRGEQSFLAHFEQLQEQWTGENTLKKFSTDVRPWERAGRSAERSDLTGTDVRSYQGGGEGTPEGGPRPEAGVQPEAGGAAQAGGGAPLIRSPEVVSRERTELLKELVRTPADQRGPLLTRFQALTEELATAKIKPAPPSAVPDAPPSALASEPGSPPPTGSARPLSDLTVQRLEELSDAYNDRILANAADMEARELLFRVSEELQARRKGIKFGLLTPVEQTRLDEIRRRRVQGLEVRAAEQAGEPPPAGLTPPPEVERVPMEPAQFRKALTSRPDRLSDDLLTQAIDELDSRLSGMSRYEARESKMDAKFAGLVEEQAQRTKAPEWAAKAAEARRIASGKIDPISRASEQLSEGKGVDETLQELRKRGHPGFRDLESNRVVGGTLAGFTYGLFSTDDDEKRLNNAFIYALAGGVGVGMGSRMFTSARARQATRRPMLPGQAEVRKNIINAHDIVPEKTSWLDRTRQVYAGLVRQTLGLDRAAASLGVLRQPAEKNFAKLAAIMGRWVTASQEALEYGPRFIDGTTETGAPSMVQVLERARGDVDGLGDLMKASLDIEQAGRGTTPNDLTAASTFFANAPEHLHQARDLIRQFHLGLAKVLADAGVLTEGAVRLFANEKMYSPMWHVFGQSEVPRFIRDQSGKLVPSPNPVKARKGGSSLPVYNPVDATIGMVPQVYRAAEMNRIKTLLMQAWEANGRPDGFLKRVRKADVPNTQNFDQVVAYLRQEIKDLDEPSAIELANALHPRSLSPADGTMTVYRNGTLESYKVNKDMLESFLALGVTDAEALTRMLGSTMGDAVAAPARLARFGVVANPWFVAKMAIIDNFQGLLLSNNGFRPGIDFVRGWMHSIFGTSQYRSFRAAGGGESSVVPMGITTARTGARDLLAYGGRRPLDTAVRQLKEMHPIQAWKTLITPVAEAGRVGEYLRALDHGKSVLDAVHDAKTLYGNYATSGGWTLIKAINRMALFTRATLESLDQSVYRTGLHPLRPYDKDRLSVAIPYFAKGMAFLAVPTAYLWYLNKDDQEINDLRGTPTGKLFWFFRMPHDAGPLKRGEIVRIPKPFLEGQIFGTTMEAALDQLNDMNPDALKEGFEAAMQQGALNLLPLVGVVPWNLAQGRGQFDAPLYPASERWLSPEHQGERKSSWLSRRVSEKIAPAADILDYSLVRNGVTPAGIDYLVKSLTGMLGDDALKTLTIIMEHEENGYVPAKSELPVIGKAFQRSPSLNVRPVREFYQNLEKMQRYSRTVSHLATHAEPSRLIRYMSDKQKEGQLVDLYMGARDDIVSMSRSIKDLEVMPSTVVPYKTRRQMIEQMQRAIIERARLTNRAAELLDYR